MRKEFGLPEDATSPGEQETAARSALSETSAALTDRLTALEPFMGALRQRVTMPLRFALAHSSASNPEAAIELAELVPLLAAVGAQMPRAHEIDSKLRPFTLLAQSRNNYANPAELGKVGSQLTAELRSLNGETQEQLKPFPYPFPHARGRITVADYARSEQASKNDCHRVYLDSTAHVERLFALHSRLIGRIVTHGNAAETKLEKQ
ncbi:MAG: hypothetical protein ABI651_21915 [Verrucomicrobiota bacterium]